MPGRSLAHANLPLLWFVLLLALHLCSCAAWAFVPVYQSSHIATLRRRAVRPEAKLHYVAQDVFEKQRNVTDPKGRDFWNALSAKDTVEFYSMMQRFFLALACGVPVSVYYRFQREKLGLYWREGMTARILDGYYKNRTFYALETLRDIDNPDQRIAEDVKAFTYVSVGFFIQLFTAVVDLISFSAILFNIYPGLFVAILAYAGVGTAATTTVGRSLVGLNFEQLQKEADFRFALVRTRENSEAIAFYDAEAKLEQAELWRRFQLLLDNQLDIIKAQRNLEFFTTGYRYLIQVLPALVVAPLYFTGSVELGAISQSFGAFNHILGDFSIIINQFESLSAFSAGVDRLSTFLHRISTGGWDIPVKTPEAAAGAAASPAEASSALTSSNDWIEYVYDLENDPSVALQAVNLTVRTPDGARDLVRGLSVQIAKGDRVLVVGNSGTGKSSLIRTIAGLWPKGAGKLRLDPTNALFFLPQKPYNLLGTLRQQVCYPSTVTADTHDGSIGVDARILEILKICKLPELAARMGAGDALTGLGIETDWGKVLSLGEQQRLAFARVLFNRPSVIVLDEATSAMDLATEATMYELLERLCSPTIISIGHRPSLLKYHSKKLILHGPDSPPLLVDIQESGEGNTLVDLNVLARAGAVLNETTA